MNTGAVVTLAAVVLLSLLNGVRDVPLQTNDALVEYAVAHSQTMADTNDLHHSQVSSIPGTYVGENVGVGPSVGSVHGALVDSPNHLRNMVDPRFISTGIGVVEVDDRVWVTQVFSDLDSTHGDAITWALERGLMQGYPDGTFRPYEPITRGQMATLLWRMENP